ncbi:MAG: polysaccharide deacetylase family protein, partial [Planctomycetaceae bacterium]
VKSHYTIARPILKKYGFGATFFITEGFTFTTNKTDYMTWDEIRELHDDGFEIGNHTRDHMSVTSGNYHLLDEQLAGIEQRCEEFGIPKPTSFAWPGNSLALEALPILREHGIRFARRGGAPEYPYDRGEGVAYQPMHDDPLLIPSAGDARPDWQLGNFIQAVSKAKDGRIAVLQFHGVPEGEHPWVHTPEELFEVYMRYLHLNGFTVIAVRDLERYVAPDARPDDPWAVITARQAGIAAATEVPPKSKTAEATTADETDADDRCICSPTIRSTRIRYRFRNRTRGGFCP